MTPEQVNYMIPLRVSLINLMWFKSEFKLEKYLSIIIFYLKFSPGRRSRLKISFVKPYFTVSSHPINYKSAPSMP